MIQLMVFFLLLSEALEWKYLVFLSPRPNHCTLDLCYHLISSLSNNSLISFHNLLMSPPKLSFLSLLTRELRLSLFSLIFFGICPNTILFHLERFSAQHLSLAAIPEGECKSWHCNCCLLAVKLIGFYFLYVEQKHRN